MSIPYYNRWGPFWDFIADLEGQGQGQGQGQSAQHPFFGPMNPHGPHGPHGPQGMRTHNHAHAHEHEHDHGHGHARNRSRSRSRNHADHAEHNPDLDSSDDDEATWEHPHGPNATPPPPPPAFPQGPPPPGFPFAQGPPPTAAPPAPDARGPANHDSADERHGPYGGPHAGPRGGRGGGHGPRGRHGFHRHGAHGHGHGHGHGPWGFGGPGGRGRGGRWGGRGGRMSWANMLPFDLGNFAEAMRGMGEGQRGGFTSGVEDVGEEAKNDDFVPPVDVFDTEGEYIIDVSLPGAKKDDIAVNWSIEKSELSITGVVHRPGNEELIASLAMTERKIGAFERKVRLGSRANPANVDEYSITAKLEDGVLRITVPKEDKEFVEVRKVDVQ